jgi:hypothetical protein
MKEELFNIIIGVKKGYHRYAQKYSAQYFKVGIKIHQTIFQRREHKK